MIHIDPVKCSRCLNCVAECPTKCLKMENDSVVRIASSVCLACGHCASVCAFNAVSWNDTDGFRPFTLSEMPEGKCDYRGVFQKTRSVRRFRPDKLDRELVTKIITDAEKAPSADNRRKREYLVVDNPYVIAEMERLVADVFKKTARLLKPFIIRALSVYSKTLADELSFIMSIVKSMEDRHLENEHPILRNAPCVIFITGPKGSLFAFQDCIAAQNYMRLSATGNDLGSCIIGFPRKAGNTLEKYLKVKQDRIIYSATILGYQEIDFKKGIDYPIPAIQCIE